MDDGQQEGEGGQEEACPDVHKEDAGVEVQTISPDESSVVEIDALR